MTDKEIEIANHYLKKALDSCKFPFEPFDRKTVIQEITEDNFINISREVVLPKKLTEKQIDKLESKIREALIHYFDLVDYVCLDHYKDCTYHIQYSFIYNKQQLRDMIIEDFIN